ncbi:MAG: peptidylprolyl isomerase [Lachnospiraceae bacterium]|nr:peptidylprolyl isomerase [Lachnospiraceae bacterium]
MLSVLKKILKRYTALIAAVLCLLSLSSCKGLELENKTEQIEEYTKPQAMILIANERNTYEKAYSSAIWDITVGENGSGFDKLTIQNVKQYMEKLKLLCMLAEERGIAVTSSERDIIRQMTDKYMDGLTDADKTYIGCDRTDVQYLYTDYFTANKLINSITSGVDSEISDSEAKVIKIEQIVTSDEKKAKAILKRIKIDGAGFSQMASRYSEADKIERTLLKDDDSDELIMKTAFSMEEGQVSNILAVGDLFYIIKCTDGYAADETKERKERLEKAINSKAVNDVLEPYGNEHKIQFRERFWDNLSFDEETGSTVVNFFDVYDKAF